MRTNKGKEDFDKTMRFFFNILLTVYVSKILVMNQLNAQILVL